MSVIRANKNSPNLTEMLSMLSLYEFLKIKVSISNKPYSGYTFFSVLERGAMEIDSITLTDSKTTLHLTINDTEIGGVILKFLCKCKKVVEDPVYFVSLLLAFDTTGDSYVTQHLKDVYVHNGADYVDMTKYIPYIDSAFKLNTITQREFEKVHSGLSVRINTLENTYDNFKETGYNGVEVLSNRIDVLCDILDVEMTEDTTEKTLLMKQGTGRNLALYADIQLYAQLNNLLRTVEQHALDNTPFFNLCTYLENHTISCTTNVLAYNVLLDYLNVTETDHYILHIGTKRGLLRRAYYLKSGKVLPTHTDIYTAYTKMEYEDTEPTRRVLAKAKVELNHLLEDSFARKLLANDLVGVVSRLEDAFFSVLQDLNREGFCGVPYILMDGDISFTLQVSNDIHPYWLLNLINTHITSNIEHGVSIIDFVNIGSNLEEAQMGYGIDLASNSYVLTKGALVGLDLRRYNRETPRKYSYKVANITRAIQNEYTKHLNATLR